MSEEKRPESEQGPVASPVPTDIIRISDAANEAIERWAFDLSADRLQFWQLPTGLQAFWTLAWTEGRTSRQPEIDRARADADRFYTRLFNPTKELKPAPASYADMERRRGAHENAERYEKWLTDLLGDFGRSTI